MCVLVVRVYIVTILLYIAGGESSDRELCYCTQTVYMAYLSLSVCKLIVLISRKGALPKTNYSIIVIIDVVLISHHSNSNYINA